MKNYYSILEVDEKSTQEEIKKSYRDKSKILHPDMGGDTKAFQELSEAYAVLSDSQKRSEYDFKLNNPNHFDMSSFNFRDNYQTTLINNSVNVECDLEDMFYNKEIVIKYTRKINVGAKTVCKKCNGSGMLTKKMNTGLGLMLIQELCDDCMGNGSFCSQKDEVIEFKTMPNWYKQNIFPNKGNQNMDDSFGGLQVNFIDKPHKDLIRKEQNLIYKKKINLSDYIIGTDIEIPYFDTTLKIIMKPDDKSSRTYRLPQKGMKYYSHMFGNGVGDLLVEVIPDIPSNLNKDEISLLEKLKKQEHFKPI